VISHYFGHKLVPAFVPPILPASEMFDLIHDKKIPLFRMLISGFRSGSWLSVVNSRSASNVVGGGESAFSP
jgi:hypothetical protein